MLKLNIDFQLFLNEAIKKGKKMLENGLYSRFNLSYEERLEKATIGAFGEIVFEKYLIYKNIPYMLDKTDFSKSNTDEFDFLINGKKIDVKMAKTSYIPQDNWTYGYPAEQNPETKDFIIVGWIDFDKEEVGFYGFIEGRKVKNYPILTKNSFAGYNYLTPNHEFKWGELNKNFDYFFYNI